MATPNHESRTKQPSVKLNAKGMKIGIVTAKWNWPITSELEKAALENLRLHGCSDIHSVYVPGAVEVPLACQWLLNDGCHAVIAFGCVIRGETTHYESVCNSVERGCTELALRANKPIVFGVLTVENDAQALDRIGGKHGNKGQESAEVAIEMIQLQRSLNDQARV